MIFSTGVSLDFAPQTLAEWGRASADYEWYAARFIPIADKEESEPHPIRLNSSQKHLRWYFDTFRNEYGGGNFLIYKGRQFGCSTLIDTMFAHQALKSPGFRAMVFAHESGAADNLLSIIRRPYWRLDRGYELPDGQIVNLKPEEHRSNRKELWVYFDGDMTRESRIIIEEATAGDTAGVSFALNALHFSEVGKDAFDDGLAIGAAMQTLSRDAMVFAEGTANGAYGWMYNTFTEVWDEFSKFRLAHKANPSLRWNGWVPIFLPWFWHYGYPGGLRFPVGEDEHIVPETEWEEMAMSGESTYMHYKCTPENIKAMRYLWDNRIKSAASESGLSAEEYRSQEYPSSPEEGFIQSGSTFFKKEILRDGLQFSRDYTKAHPPTRYKWEGTAFVQSAYGDFHFIKEPNPSKYKYVIGGDVAKGLRNKDWDVNIIIEIRADGPNCVIGYWRAHEDDKYMHAILTRNLADWVGATAVAVENDKFGVAVNDHLRRMRCHGLYISTPEDEGSFSPGHSTSYGWNPTGKSRGIMLGQLQASLRKWYENSADPEGLVVPFPEIWTELQAFVKIDGKPQATVGAHDDMVMAMAIATSVSDDVVPKKVRKPIDPEVKHIKQLESMGLTYASKFYRNMRKLRRAK